MAQRFEEYTDFLISELTSVDVVLPEVVASDRTDLVAAAMWRVVIMRPKDENRPPQAGLALAKSYNNYRAML